MEATRGRSLFKNENVEVVGGEIVVSRFVRDLDVAVVVIPRWCPGQKFELVVRTYDRVRQALEPITSDRFSRDDHRSLSHDSLEKATIVVAPSPTSNGWRYQENWSMGRATL